MALAVPIAATADPIDGNKPQPVSQSAQPAPLPPPDQTAGPQAAPSPGATSALAAIQSRIASQVAQKGNTYTFGSYLDPGTGKIVDHAGDWRGIHDPILLERPHRFQRCAQGSAATATLGGKDDGE